jgi:hypothetical protein
MAGLRALDGVHVGPLDLVEKLARVGGERFHVAALALGVDGVEGKRALARAGEAGDHRERVARDAHVDVAQIVLARPAHRDVSDGHGSAQSGAACPGRGRQPSGRCTQSHLRALRARRARIPVHRCRRSAHPLPFLPPWRPCRWKHPSESAPGWNSTQQSAGRGCQRPPMPRPEDRWRASWAAGAAPAQAAEPAGAGVQAQRSRVSCADERICGRERRAERKSNSLARRGPHLKARIAPRKEPRMQSTTRQGASLY